VAFREVTNAVDDGLWDRMSAAADCAERLGAYLEA
jgi:hypothetical protein